MSFETAIEFVLQREGGYVNDPADPGGETKYGISKRAYPNEDIKNLTVGRAKELYRRDYWLAAGCDKLPEPMDLIVMDTAVNHGVRTATQLRMTFLTPEDYLWARLDTYRQIVKKRPASLKFLVGWILRLHLLRTAAGL